MALTGFNALEIVGWGLVALASVSSIAQDHDESPAIIFNTPRCHGAGAHGPDGGDARAPDHKFDSYARIDCSFGNSKR